MHLTDVFLSFQMKNHHTNNPLLTPKPDSKGACLLFFLSFHLCQCEGSVDERQDRRKRDGERRSGELHCVDPFWLALHRARLIIIKTHTTWHVYLMAAPGKDGKLLLSLTVTCWSTTVPCVTPSVCEWDDMCVSWHYSWCSCVLKDFAFLYHKETLLLGSVQIKSGQVTECLD